MQHEDKHLQSEVEIKSAAQSGHRKPIEDVLSPTFTRRGVEELPAAVFRKQDPTGM